MTTILLLTWIATSGIGESHGEPSGSLVPDSFAVEMDALEGPDGYEVLPATLGQGAPAKKERNIGFSIGLMLTRETGDLESRGFGALFEMRWRTTPNLWLGFRIEGAGMQSAEFDGTGAEFDQHALAAITAKATFFFLDGTARPYAALGAGYAWWGSESASTDGGTFEAKLEAGAGFVVAPGIGIDLSIVRIGFTYTLILEESRIEVSIGQTEDVRRDYWALELSASF
jgi:hypothetical protein